MIKGRFYLLLGSAAALSAGIAIAQAQEVSVPASQHAFKSLDTNGDGRLELGEFKPKAQRRFARFDGNGDGTVTGAEIEATLQKPLERRRDRILARLDADKNGQIGRDEVDRFVEGLFNQADADHDGAVTEDEARAFRTALRQKFRASTQAKP